MTGAHDECSTSGNQMAHDTVAGLRADTGGTDTGSACERVHDTGRPVQADGETGLDAGTGADTRVVLRQAQAQAWRDGLLVYDAQPGDIIYTHTTAMNLVIQAVHSAHGKAEHAAMYIAMQALIGAGIMPVTCPQCHRDLYVAGPECRGHCGTCEKRGE